MLKIRSILLILASAGFLCSGLALAGQRFNVPQSIVCKQTTPGHVRCEIAANISPYVELKIQAPKTPGTYDFVSAKTLGVIAPFSMPRYVYANPVNGAELILQTGYVSITADLIPQAHWHNVGRDYVCNGSARFCPFSGVPYAK